MMVSEFCPNIDKSLNSAKKEGLTIAINNALQNPLPQEEYWKLDEKLKDGILVNSKDDFELLLKIIQEKFVWVDDDYIQKTIEHETEHIEKAREILSRYGNAIHYKYGVRFLQMNNGNIGIHPYYLLLSNESVKPTKDEIAQITDAPKNKSPGDRKKMGEINVDINDNY